MKITIQIQGGLGNQIFQYAMGKAMSQQYKGDLLLDASWFERSWDGVTPRHFLLPELKIQCRLAPDAKSYGPPKRWRRLTQKILPISPYLLKDHQDYVYDEKVAQLPLGKSQDLYLIGYWQSFRYFESIRKQLVSEIQPAFDLSAQYQIYLKQIQQQSSAMVHIRRGDYVHLESAAKVHGFLGLEYYKTGMAILLDRDPTTHFFVFSDDIDWAQTNLPHQDRITFIESTNDTRAPVEELFLMSQCRKHIIANSSLSWWGAWLSDAPEPQVIAPKRWTNDANRNLDDLMPAHWQRISTT